MGRHVTMAGGAMTERQAEILSYIVAYQAEHGYSPAIRDIGHAMGHLSPNGTMSHLKALARKGRISWDPVKSRTIKVIPTQVAPASEGRCPCCGQALPVAS